MKKKNLTDLYKKQLAESAEKAPEGLWDDIARELDYLEDEQLITQYKKELHQSPEKAPAGLWADISRKMDIDEVWGGIAAGLDQQTKKSGLWWIGRAIAAAIAILLVSTLSVWLINNFSGTVPGLAETNSETRAPEQDLPPQKFDSVNPVDFATPPVRVAASADNKTKNDNEDATQITQASLEEANQLPEAGNASDGILPNTLFAVQTESSYTMQGNPAMVTTSLPPAPSVIIPKQDLITTSNPIIHSTQDGNTAIFALGFTTAMKNTWLFNHETFKGFDPASGSKTHVKIYPDIAVGFRYFFPGKWSIESNFSFSSNAGQSYQQYIYGRFSQREIILNYFHAEILAGYNHRKRWIIGSGSISHSSSAGFYYGILNAANESIAGEKEDVSPLYRKDDYGFVAGHNLHIAVAGNLVFSPGLYFTWGIPNIYQGEHILPSLKRTHNSSVELRLSLHYNFSR